MTETEAAKDPVHKLLAQAQANQREQWAQDKKDNIRALATDDLPTLASRLLQEAKGEWLEAQLQKRLQQPVQELKRKLLVDLEREWKEKLEQEAQA